MEVLTEKYPRAPVELGDDDALGTVHHKGPLTGHVGDVTQEHILDNGLEVHVLFVVTRQPQFSLQGDTVGKPTLHTLLDGVAGGVNEIIQELQIEDVPGIGDGEVFLENPVEAFVCPVFGRRFQLEELLERLKLNLEKIGGMIG